MELDLSEAFKIAIEVHSNQRDKNGLPYLGHILRVMDRMDTDEERVVAILHDVLEDCDGRDSTNGQATYFAQRIAQAYGLDVLETCIDLVHGKTEPYMDYIRHLSTNPLAVKVKLADLRDNTKLERMAKLAPEEADRLLRKYYEAYAYLLNAKDQGFYPTGDLSPDSAPPAK